MPRILIISKSQSHANEIEHFLRLYGKLSRDEGYKYDKVDSEHEAFDYISKTRDPDMVIHNYGEMGLAAAIAVKKEVEKTIFCLFSPIKVESDPTEVSRLKGFFGDDLIIAQVKKNTEYKELMQKVVDHFVEEEENPLAEQMAEAPDPDKAAAIGDFFSMMKKQND